MARRDRQGKKYFIFNQSQDRLVTRCLDGIDPVILQILIWPNCAPGHQLQPAPDLQLMSQGTEATLAFQMQFARHFNDQEGLVVRIAFAPDNPGQGTAIVRQDIGQARHRFHRPLPGQSPPFACKLKAVDENFAYLPHLLPRQNSR